MHLFGFYLGGKHENANIEIHDVQFVVSDTLKNCFPILKEKWIGRKDKLHIDSYIQLDYLDGYEIKPVSSSDSQTKKSIKKLVFINLGGAKEDEFYEYHQSGFFIVNETKEALLKARKSFLKDMFGIHKDDMFDVDDVLDIGSNLGEFSLEITKSKENKPDSKAVAKYIKIK